MEKLSIIIDYLDQKEEGNFYDTSRIFYERKLAVFEEFASKYFSINEKNYKELLRGMGQENITKSMEFYLTRYNINSKDTLDGYLTVLTNFFNYMSDIGIKNENFEDREKINKLKKELTELAKKYNLTKSEKIYPLTKEAFDLLCIKCDENIENFDKDNIKVGGNDGNFSRYISSLITKIVIVTAIKNNVIDNLKIEDNYRFGMIKINNFWVRLPDKLSIQLDDYVNIVRARCNINNIDDLFINRKGESLSGNNSVYFTILKSLFNIMSNASVAKFRIMEMIKSGVAPSIIISYIGYALGTYLHCLDILSSIDREKAIEEYTEKINSDNMSWEYYYRL